MIVNKRSRYTAKVGDHINTAIMLLDSAAESIMAERDKWGYTPKEHSTGAIKTCLLRARTEILIAMKEMEKEGERE